MGVGALAGALLMASRARPSRRLLVGAAFAFGVVTIALALAPGYVRSGSWLLVLLGGAGVLFVARPTRCCSSTPRTRCAAASWLSGRRLPRQHADRRAAHRPAGARVRRARGGGGRRRRRPGHRGRRLLGAAPSRDGQERRLRGAACLPDDPEPDARSRGASSARPPPPPRRRGSAGDAHDVDRAGRDVGSSRKHRAMPMMTVGPRRARPPASLGDTRREVSGAPPGQPARNSAFRTSSSS